MSSFCAAFSKNNALRLFAVILSLAAYCAKAQTNVVKVAWCKADITPQVGTLVAGYGNNDVSAEKIDPLFATALAVESGGKKILIVSLDLLGLDAPVIREFRRGLADILDVEESAVLITCTHTHGGPHSRMLNGRDDKMKLDYSIDRNPPPGLNAEYLKFLRTRLHTAVGALASSRWVEAVVGYYSSTIDLNRNRRFTTADNCASFIAHRRALHKLAAGIADKEFGMIVMLDPERRNPLFVMGNYAAHPLCAHSPGRGGLRISSDFPGFFRRYVKSETGAEAMFVQGACGDVVPKDDELGLNAAKRVGEALAEEAISSIIDVQRNAARFVMQKPRVASLLGSIESPILKRQRHLYDGDKVKLEIQCVSIGDIAFVGVPGELVNELGLEMKWHSPFRRTFIAYAATDYFGYISTVNQVAAGGYEPLSQRFVSRDSLRLVNLAADTLAELRKQVFPEDYSSLDQYPDSLVLPIVNLPGGIKQSRQGNAK